MFPCTPSVIYNSYLRINFFSFDRQKHISQIVTIKTYTKIPVLIKQSVFLAYNNTSNVVWLFIHMSIYFHISISYEVFKAQS